MAVKEIEIKKIVAYVQGKIKDGDYKNLTEISPEMFWKRDSIVVEYDKQKRLKFIAVRIEPWGGIIFDLRIGKPGKSLLSERGDLTRLSRIGFDVKLPYSNTIWDEVEVANHYHIRKKEIFYLPNEEEGKIIFFFEELNTGEMVNIELCGHAIEILGQPYYISILMDKEVFHKVTARDALRVDLLVLSNQPYDEEDDFKRGEWIKDK